SRPRHGSDLPVVARSPDLATAPTSLLWRGLRPRHGLDLPVVARSPTSSRTRPPCCGEVSRPRHDPTEAFERPAVAASGTVRRPCHNWGGRGEWHGQETVPQLGGEWHGQETVPQLSLWCHNLGIRFK